MRCAFAIAAVMIGCGGPVVGADGTISVPAENCPVGSHLEGSKPPANGKASMIVIAWYEQACMDGDHHHGPAVTYWGNGKAFSVGEYDGNGDRTGTWSYYYDTGELFARGGYHEDFAQPGWTYFQRDGAPLFWEPGGAGCPAGTQLANDMASEPSFEYWCEKPDHTRHGPYASWRGMAGWMFEHYVDGQEDGTSTRWSDSDRVRHVLVYDHGWLLSETLWYGDHPFEYTESLKDNGGDGRDNGMYRAWYPDGTIEREGPNRNGCRDGTWTHYDPTGKPVARATYDHCTLVSRDDLWHCVDAKHLLRAQDFGGGMTDARIAGEPEAADYSTVELTGGGKRASLRLWKSNFDDSQGVYSWLLEQTSNPDYMHGDELAFEDAVTTYGGDPAVAFMDLELGGVALLVCPKSTCRDRAAITALAKVVHHRLLYDRWCVETIE